MRGEKGRRSENFPFKKRTICEKMNKSIADHMSHLL